jgi:ribose-phosphate pyrophosphokinase
LSVSCFATHGLFTGKAIENIKKSQLDQVIVTNTIPPKENE